MAYATGSKADLGYVMEAEWGTTPESPSLKRLRFVSESMKASIAGLASKEIRSDRQITAMTQGNLDVSGSINFELSHNSFDDLLEAALFNDWDEATKAGATLACVVGDPPGTPSTITDSGNGFVTAGFLAGNLIKISGSGSTPSNNGYYTIATVAAGTLTLISTEELPAAESANAALTIDSSELKCAAVEKFFTLEKAFTDIEQYLLYTGCMISGLSINVVPGGDAMITGSFDLVGKGHSASGATVDAGSGYTDVATTTPFNAFSGDLYEGGSAIGYLTSLQMKLTNPIPGRWAIGSSNEKAGMFPGRANCTGSISAFFQDLTLYNKFLGATPTSIKVIFSDGTNRFVMVIPTLKYFGDGSPQVGSEGEVMINLNFQAYRDPTTELTALKFCRYEAPA